jgi:hypothetical protein
VVHPDRDYYQAEAVAASPADLGRIDTVVVSQENYDLHALVAAGFDLLINLAACRQHRPGPTGPPKPGQPLAHPASTGADKR